MASFTEKDSWTDCGVFSFFNFTHAVIKHFTIEASLTRLEKKEKKNFIGNRISSWHVQNVWLGVQGAFWKSL